jgi:hypothetical protein
MPLADVEGMNAIDDECTALVRRAVDTKRWGEIVYISGHQETGY